MDRRAPLQMLALLLAAACGGQSSPPPVAVDLHGTTTEDMPFHLSSLWPNGAPAGYVEYDKPTHGVLDGVIGGGDAVYVPDPGFHGTETFAYAVTDEDGDSASAHVTIDVTSNGLPYQLARQLDAGYGTGLAAGDVNGDGRDDLVVMFDDLTVLANSSQPGQMESDPGRRSRW